MDFSETIAASDLYVSIEGQGHFLTLDKGRVHKKKIKSDFLRNYCADLNQTFYESFPVQGNEKLMT